MRLRIPLPPLLSLALFTGLCAIVAYWAMLLLSPVAPIAPASGVAAGSAPTDPARTAALFGAVPTGPVQTSTTAAPVNLRITGVIATPPSPRASAGASGASGIALISIDGQPAKPYAVGDTLPNGLKVQAIRKDAVDLLDQGRLLSAPAPAGADPSVLVRGFSPPSTTPSPGAPGLTGTRPPPPVPVAPAQPTPRANAAAADGMTTPEAPMPPPPPAPPGGVAPGPLPMPAQ